MQVNIRKTVAINSPHILKYVYTHTDSFTCLEQRCQNQLGHKQKFE